MENKNKKLIYSKNLRKLKYLINKLMMKILMMTKMNKNSKNKLNKLKIKMASKNKSEQNILLNFQERILCQ